MSVITTRRSYPRTLARLALPAALAFALGPSVARAQGVAKHRPAPAPAGVKVLPPAAAEPLLREYRGITLGISADEARAKLGVPADQSDGQDFYSFSETESAQIFYDPAHKVMAVCVQYFGDGAPAPRAVFGKDVPPREDGSVYKMVAYPRAGYWVSYNRSAGDSPVVTVTMRSAP